MPSARSSTRSTALSENSHARTSQTGQTVTFRPRSGMDGLALHRRSLGAGVASQDFPVRRNEFPVPDYRELVAAAVVTPGNFGLGYSRGVGYRRKSLYFPYGSGNSFQRRVRPRLHPPPSSLAMQRLSARPRAERCCVDGAAEVSHSTGCGSMTRDSTDGRCNRDAPSAEYVWTQHGFIYQRYARAELPPRSHSCTDDAHHRVRDAAGLR